MTGLDVQLDAVIINVRRSLKPQVGELIEEWVYVQRRDPGPKTKHARVRGQGEAAQFTKNEKPSRQRTVS